ncbi:hypothetical protein BDV34DRAFT_196883 [Aspergillus parasiticus]|uniref:Uncharacterized protein n=1 Tax=Aspergillus parasiticus TaxID=5067 RepID=A0A5N6DJN8_ASPPA|nr:hypothetical protein BDV34DRAFT_196883 [Aspergillus parasiticus]
MLLSCAKDTGSRDLFEEVFKLFCRWFRVPSLRCFCLALLLVCFDEVMDGPLSIYHTTVGVIVGMHYEGVL